MVLGGCGVGSEANCGVFHCAGSTHSPVVGVGLVNKNLTG